MIRAYTIIGIPDAVFAERMLENLKKHPYVVKADIYFSSHKLVIEMNEYIPVHKLQQIIDPEHECIIREDETREN